MSICLKCECYNMFRAFSSVMDLRCHSRWHRCWHQEACGLTSPKNLDSSTESYQLCTSACRTLSLSIFANVDISQLLFPSALLDRIAGWHADHISRGRDRTLSLCASWLGTAHPSNADFEAVLQVGGIDGCTIKVDNAKVAYKIWGACP